MRVIVVGAGAVGQVYAHHLLRGGAEVAFRVRDPGKATPPFVIHDLNRKATERFTCPVYGTDEEVRAFAPDHALITVPADALRGPWLAPFLEAVGDATVVSLAPGVEEDATIRAARPGVVLAQGVIALIAYQAPLPGEEARFPEPGIAVFYPWVGSCPFAGPNVAPFAEVLRKGGLRTSVKDSLAAESAFGTIAFATWVTTLRAAGWRFDGMAAVGPLGRAATVQGLTIASRRVGARPPPWAGFLRSGVIRAVFWLGARLLPLPLETYLRVHFTKVGAQTRQHLTEQIRHGRELGLPVDGIEALLAKADEVVPPR